MHKKGRKEKSRLKIHRFWEKPLSWVTLSIVIVGLLLISACNLQLPNGKTIVDVFTTSQNTPPQSSNPTHLSPCGIICSKVTTCALQEEIMNTVNVQRKQLSYNSVTLNDGLSELAFEHCTDMAKAGDAFSLVKDEMHYRVIWAYTPDVCSSLAISEAFVNNKGRQVKLLYPYAKQVGLGSSYSSVNNRLYVVWVINKDDVMLTDRRYIEALPEYYGEYVPRKY